MPTKDKTKMLEHFLVIGQFLGIGLCCYPLGTGLLIDRGYLMISLIGGIGGVVTLLYNRIGNFKVYPKVKAKAKLITSGPYAFVRHPMYLFLFLIMLGLTLASFQYKSLFGLGIIVICVSVKAVKEEQYLIEKFPEYRCYMTRSKRIIPWIW